MYDAICRLRTDANRLLTALIFRLDPPPRLLVWDVVFSLDERRQSAHSNIGQYISIFMLAAWTWFLIACIDLELWLKLPAPPCIKRGDPDAWVPCPPLLKSLSELTVFNPPAQEPANRYYWLSKFHKIGTSLDASGFLKHSIQHCSSLWLFHQKHIQCSSKYAAKDMRVQAGKILGGCSKDTVGLAV